MGDESVFGRPDFNSAAQEWVLVFEADGAQAHGRGFSRTIFSGAIHRIADDGQAGVRYPAAYPQVLAVGAVDARLRRLRQSNFGRHLALVATELDTGRPVAFGSPGWDHVPISRAVQATCALPGMFPPVEIDGRPTPARCASWPARM